MISLKKAYSFIRENVSPIIGDEDISISECEGRILSEDIITDRHLPPFNRSMMDGICFPFERVDLQFNLSVVEDILAGHPAKKELKNSNEVYRIMTGAPLPNGCDTVIPVEELKEMGSQLFWESNKIHKGQFVHKIGSDAQEGDSILKAPIHLNSRHAAVLASVGKTVMKVKRSVLVTLFSTGDEIIEANGDPKPWEIRDANTPALRSYLKQFPTQIREGGILKDEKSELLKALKEAMDSDLIILSGGVSMGTHDFLPQVLQDLNVSQIFHKINIRPGKPVWFGKKENGPIVLALPGNPVSVQVTARLLLPLIFSVFNKVPFEEPTYEVPLASSFTKKGKRDHYAMAKLHDGKAFPVANTGSGDFVDFSKANCLIVMDHLADTELYEGELVKVVLL